MAEVVIENRNVIVELFGPAAEAARTERLAAEAAKVAAEDAEAAAADSASDAEAIANSLQNSTRFIPTSISIAAPNNYTLIPAVPLPATNGYDVYLVQRFPSSPVAGDFVLKVDGINPSDPFLLKKSDGVANVDPTSWDGPTDVMFTRSGSNTYRVVDVFGVSSLSADAKEYTIATTQTNVSGNTYNLMPIAGQTPPNNTGRLTVARFQVTTAQAEGGVLAFLSWINPADPFSIRTLAGAEITPGDWSVGDWIEIGRLNTEGNVYLWLNQPSTGTVSTSGDPYLDYYAGQSASQSRYKLDAHNPQFTGVMQIGNAVQQGSDPAFVHARTLLTPTSSPHAFSDSAALNFSTNALAYNSFESRFQVTGTANYNHFNGFQMNGQIATSGVTTDLSCFFAAPIINTGTITTAVAFDFYGWRGTGTITTGTAIRISDSQALMTGGGTVTNKNAIHQLGVNDWNRFAGPIEASTRGRWTGDLFVPTTGAGLEVCYNPLFNAGQGAANILSYDRGGAAYKPMFIAGLTVSLRAGTGGADRVIAAQTKVSIVGAALELAAGVSLASATTTDIGASASNIVTVTGTTTITAFGTGQIGAIRFVTFAGVLVLTHNASTLLLPGNANITTAAGDDAQFICTGAGAWRCINYQRRATAP